MNFGLTLTSVLIMILYAIPAYILVKVRAVKESAIPALSMLLLYVCQPCLQLYSFQKVPYTRELLTSIGIVFAFTIVLQVLLMTTTYLLFRKKYEDVSYRVLTVSAVFGNVGFLGVPILTQLLPDYPEAICFSAVFIVAMNLLSWTMGAFLLTGKKDYISAKKIFINPPMLALTVSLPMFFTNFRLAESAPQLYTVVELLAKMTTPLCMFVLGMRFATMKPKTLFNDKIIYLSGFIKLVAMPLIAFCALLLLQLDTNLTATLYILCCMPSASIVLNLAEINGSGQQTAANTMLFSTMACVLTVPLLLLLL